MNLAITFEDVDPTLLDPESLANDLVDTWNEGREHGYIGPPAALVKAEWIDDEEEDEET